MSRKALIIGIALLLLIAFGSSGLAQADATPTPDHMLDMGGTPMPPDGHNHERIPANGAAVKIIAPEHNAVLDRPMVIVRVEVANWPLGEAGHHWHLYVNGQEQGMSQGNSPALQARDLRPGENIIEAVLSNELHQELNATDTITVRFDASSAAAAAPALSTGVVFVLLGIAVAILAILGIGYMVTRKKTR
jgi:hypothetical protein